LPIALEKKALQGDINLLSAYVWYIIQHGELLRICQRFKKTQYLYDIHRQLRSNKKHRLANRKTQFFMPRHLKS